jgi:hypothetical protein
MYKNVKFATFKRDEDSVMLKLYDEYPKWSPLRFDLLHDVSISVSGNGISIKGKREIVDQGFGLHDALEIKNPEEYEDGDCEKKEISEWNGWFKWSKREAYFATKIWITKKIKPTVEINTSMYTIIDKRQKGNG